MSSIEHDDQEKIRKILIHFYGPQARAWTINEAVYLEIVKLIQKSGQCTAAMHFVPRPVLFGSPAAWLKKEIIKSVLRFLTSDENTYYIVCMKFTALHQRSKIELASQGL